MIRCRRSAATTLSNDGDCPLRRSADLLDFQLHQFPSALDALRTQLPEDANAAQAIEAFVRSAANGDDRARRARQALRAEVEADASGPAEDQSLRWIWNEVEYDGDLFGDLPRDGYRSLLQPLADGLDIRHGSIVDTITATDAVVQIALADGGVEQASHVVVTVPLGVLKSGALNFVPALPADKQDAISELGFGRYEKVVLVFDRPFWRDAGMSHLQYFPTNGALAGDLVLRPRRLRRRPGPGSPSLSHHGSRRPRHVADRDHRVGPQHRVRRVRAALPSTSIGPCDVVVRGSVRPRLLHTRTARCQSELPRHDRSTRPRSRAVRRRAHSKCPDGVRRRSLHQRDSRSQAVARGR